MGAILNYQSYIQAFQLLNNFNEYIIREALGQLGPKAADAIPVRHALV